ncbi:MAG: hypothetical protein OEM52_08405 [bacterium]|nr:hypothetical protein [bacterium]
MRHSKPTFLLLLIVVCVLAQTTLSNALEPIPTVINSIDSLYRYGEIDAAEQLAVSALNRKDVSSEERFRLEMLLAYAYVAKNDRDGAKQAFLRALTLKPDYQLDPDAISPKIFEIFSEARHVIQSQTTTSKEDLLRLRKYETRWRGTPSGLLFPAWGLARQEKIAHAWIFGSLEIAAIGAATYATISTANAKDDYQKARTNNNPVEKWNDYKDWYRKQGYLWGSVGLIHLLGVSDVLFGKVPIENTVTISSPDGSPTVSFQVNILQFMH